MLTLMKQVRVLCFTDVLCVWAYVGQVRLDELERNFGEQVRVECHFCPVFGDMVGKVGSQWAERGGVSAYARQLVKIAEKHPHIRIRNEGFAGGLPPSSMSPHLFLCAVRLWERESGVGGACQRATWELRRAFFEDRAAVSRRAFQLEVAERVQVPVAAIEELLDSGLAHAELSKDYELAKSLDVRVSPSLVLDEGRQRLNGNVGYRVIEANIRELLREPTGTQASWC